MKIVIFSFYASRTDSRTTGGVEMAKIKNINFAENINVACQMRFVLGASGLQQVTAMKEQVSETLLESKPSAKALVLQHFKKHGIKYRIAGSVIFLCLGYADIAFAAGPIDREGHAIYKDLLSVGKWVIIVKGGWEVIKSMLDSDFESCKRKFVGYLMAYGLLHLLPAGMDKMDGIFAKYGG
jgi:hypothetical protein